MINDYQKGNTPLSKKFFKTVYNTKQKVLSLPPLDRLRRWVWMKRSDRQFGKDIPAAYRACLSKPIDRKKIIFVENRESCLSDNFRLIYEDAKAAGYHIHIDYLHEFDPNVDVKKTRIALARDAADARYIILNDSSTTITALPLRKGTKVIQLWHACGAFKKFGHSTADKKFGANEKERQKHHVAAYGNLDLVTVSSPEVRWAYIEAMDLQDRKEIVQATGISRTDMYFDDAFVQQNLDKVHEVFPASIGKKIILYAPTFRGRVAGASTPDFETFDLRRLRKEFGKDCVIVIKNHPYIGPDNTPKVPKELDGTFTMDLSHTLSIETLLCAADICITDYSSVIFEYSLLQRPMIFYAFDLEDYNDWRGFYYDYSEMTPGPVCQNMDQLTRAIQNAAAGRYDAGKLQDFRDRFMQSCDGHATSRIEKLIFGKSLRS